MKFTPLPKILVYIFRPLKSKGQRGESWKLHILFRKTKSVTHNYYRINNVSLLNLFLYIYETVEKNNIFVKLKFLKISLASKLFFFFLKIFSTEN